MKPLRSFPLEVPAPTRPYSRTAARLGWHPAAAALATLGWLTVPQVTVRDQSRAGGTSVTFFIAGRPGMKELTHKAAESLVSGAILRGKKSLYATDPAHLFLVALAAVENLAALADWHRHGGILPNAFLTHAAPGPAVLCPYLTLLFNHEAGCRPERHRRLWLGGKEPAFGITDATVAAALIACGFIPFPEPVFKPAKADASQPSPLNPQPAIGIDRESATLPGFTFLDAHEAAKQIVAADARPRGIRVPVTLPAYPPDEHPFIFALRAARNVAILHRMARAAAKDPLRHFTSPHASQRTALVTDHLLHTGKNPVLLRELEKHLRRSA